MKEEAHPKIKGSRANSGNDPRGFASPTNRVFKKSAVVNNKNTSGILKLSMRVPKVVKDNLRRKFPDGITIGENAIAINQSSRDIINLAPISIQERTKNAVADRFTTKAQNDPGDSQSATAMNSITDSSEKAIVNFQRRIPTAKAGSGCSLERNIKNIFRGSRSTNH